MGEPCTTMAPGGRGKVDTEGGRRQARRVPVTTLDGGSHDARWQKAGLGEAPVLGERVAELHQPRAHEAADGPDPVPVGASPGGGAERPW